jgi:hypothetical protein
MKTFSSNNKFLSLFLFILALKYILNDGCFYKKNKEDTEWSVTDNNYLSGVSGDDAKQKCFSLSNYKEDNKLCCYDQNNGCYIGSSDTDSNCPKKSLKVFNNCGMAGIYEPVNSEICTDIALVQGYCCLAKISEGHTACIRTKKLNKNKNTETEEILNYVKKCDENLKVESVICNGYFLKFHLLLIILSLIIF